MLERREFDEYSWQKVPRDSDTALLPKRFN